MFLRFLFRLCQPAAGAFFALMLGALHLPVSAQEATGSPISEWLQSIDASPDWTVRYRSLDYDPAARTAAVEGLVVSAATGDASLEVDRLSLAGYEPVPGNGFKAQSMLVDHATVKTRGSDIRIADIRLSDITVPMLPPVQFDPARSFSSLISAYSALAKASLASGRIGEVTLTRALEGVTSRISYRNIGIGPVASGRIESLRAGPLEIAAPTTDPLLTMTIAGAEARTMDLNAFLYVYDPQRYLGGVGDMRWRAAVADATYRDIAITIPGVTISFNAITVQGFKTRQPKESFAPLADIVSAERPVSQSAMNAAISRYLASMLSAYGFDRLLLEGMQLKAVGVDHFGFDRFSISGASSDRIAEIALDNFETVAPGQGRVGARRAAIGGIVMPPIEKIVEALDLIRNDGDPDFSAMAPTFSKLDLEGIDLQAVDFDGLALGALRLGLADHVGTIPTSVDFTLSDLDLPANALQPQSARRMIEGLGYDRLQADARMKMKWNESTSTLSLDTAELAVNDLGRLTAKATLGGVTREALEAANDRGGKIDGATFERGTVAFQDESAVERALESRAKILNVPVDRLRQQLSGALPLMLAVLGNAERMKSIIPVLQQFLTAPGTLTVEASPASPVPLDTVMRAVGSRPQSLMETLNVTIAGEPRKAEAETAN